MRAAALVEGRTVLYVSHNMSTIRQLCDRCIVLDEGKIVFDGDVDKAVSLYMGTGEQMKKEFRDEMSFAIENNKCPRCGHPIIRKGYKFLCSYCDFNFKLQSRK